MLKGKTILITGSSRGIGRATAELAAQNGANIIVHGKTDTDELTQFAKSINAQKVVFDATDKTAVQLALKDLESLDGLINCIGIPKVASFLESTDEDWLEVFKVNVLGIVHVCQAVIPLMQEKGGKIVNIASVRGHDVGAGIFNMPYSTTKSAIKNLSASLAKAFAPKINVNSVSPGFTETDFSKTWNETVWNVVKSSLIGRVGQPPEIAGLLCFLVGDYASFITGQDFVVDGGLLMSGLK